MINRVSLHQKYQTQQTNNSYQRVNELYHERIIQENLSMISAQNNS